MSGRFSNCSNIGKLILMIGFLVTVPLFVLIFYPNEIKYLPAFAIPAVLSFIIGGLLCSFSKQDAGINHWQVNMQNGSMTVLATWVYGFLAGAMPFVIAKQLNPLQALFEAVSGWTTTGLSVMDVTVTPQIFLFHRSFMQFCGGLGFVMVMLMFTQGKQAMNLFSAEGHPDKLMPNLKRTAQTIFIMYNSFVLIGTVFYRLFGMSWFDGLCHSMCALSTGGFSTKLNSIGEYNSLSHEFITIILMLIGTTNFAVLLLLAKRKFKQLSLVSEVRFMFLLLLVAIPLITFSLMRQTGMNILDALRHSSFNTISALSTTGYSTLSFDQWSPFAIGLLIIIMLIGGGIGSTAGGIKLSRTYLMFRIGLLNLQRKMSPSRKIEAPYYMKSIGKAPIDTNTANDTTGFFLAYIAIFAIGSLLLTFTADCSLMEAMFEFASALGTVGLSIGVTSAESSTGTLIVEIFGMILGRLEIFIVLIGIYYGFWSLQRKFHKE